MPRGKGKSKITLTEQIAAKKETIQNLENQLKEEKGALKILEQTQAAAEVEKLQKFISAVNLTPEKAINILKEHTQPAESAD